MPELLAVDTPENLRRLINRLATSTSPYAITLLEAIMEFESDANLIGYAHQAIPKVKEQIFYAYKDSHTLEKDKAKKELHKLESSAVHEHIEALLALSDYLQAKNQLNTPKKYFARAYALDPTILNDADCKALASTVFGHYLASLEEELEDYIQEQNKNKKVLKSKYPWYVYAFDYAVYMMWIVVIALAVFTYMDVSREYPARCRGGATHSRTCINWELAIADNFAKIAPHIPRQNVGIVLAILLLCTAIRLFSYIFQTQPQVQHFRWLDVARENVFADIEENLLRILTPREKKAKPMLK